ncbi:MAG: cob(I)yrinic acid a,c-diamide adenosyltransferase [Rhodothermales bacterium]
MKIYTRTGDHGLTGLFGGPRVSKDDLRIEAYGTTDELNSVLGVARASLASYRPNPFDQPERTQEAAVQAPSASDWAPRLDAWIERIQNELFDLGADLATPLDSKANVFRITQDWIDDMEADIDRFDENLAPLKAFILPGGCDVAAQLHTARTVCRRAERRVISLAKRDDINMSCAVYLNRLSDALFVAARLANHRLGILDHTWISSTNR